MVSLSVQERFDQHYIPEPNSGCFLWTSGVNKKGYGKFSLRVKGEELEQYAHRMSWKIHHGDIPHESWVLHKCDMPCCVNPDHLYLGTHLDNMRDRSRRGRVPRTHQIGLKGSENGSSKLTEGQVATIRFSNLKSSDLAKEFQVTHYHINKIRRGAAWRHLSNG
jgi:hypothetical protein